MCWTMPVCCCLVYLWSNLISIKLLCNASINKHMNGKKNKIIYEHIVHNDRTRERESESERTRGSQLEREEAGIERKKNRGLYE